MKIDFQKSFDNTKANQLRNQILAIDNLMTQLGDDESEAIDASVKALLSVTRKIKIQDMEEIIGVRFVEDFQAV